MLLLFLTLISLVLLLSFKLPILFIVFYLIYFGLLIFYFIKKKNVNIWFIVAFIGFAGVFVYFTFLMPRDMALMLAEKKSASGFESIYRNISFVAKDYEFLNGKYYVPVTIYAGGFNVGRSYQIISLPLYYNIAGYIFLFTNAFCLILSIVLIAIDKTPIQKATDFASFRKSERLRKTINQMITIIAINFFIILILMNEEFAIYGAKSYDLADSTSVFIGITNPFKIAFSKPVSTRFGNILLKNNFLFILSIILLITSGVILSIGKRYRRFEVKKFMLFIFVSAFLFITSMVITCFTPTIINNNTSLVSSIVSSEENLSYFYAYSGTMVFQYYRIISLVIISLFYIFILYFSHLRAKAIKK